MHKVDKKLADWMEAYSRLKDVQARFKSTTLTPADAGRLQEELAKRKQEAEAALKDLQEAVHAVKGEPAVEPRQ
jgi:hypothetical protein